MELINQIPEWLGAGICAAIGWFAHIGYGAWQKRNAPFEQDVQRFDSIIKAIDPHAIEYFVSADVVHFSGVYSDQLLNAYGTIDLINKFEKSCIDKELNKNERELVKSLNEITNFIAWKSYYRTGSTTSRTFLWETFNNQDADDLQAKKELQDSLNKFGKKLSNSFQAYKAYGDRRFAKRVSE